MVGYLPTLIRYESYIIEFEEVNEKNSAILIRMYTLHLLELDETTSPHVASLIHNSGCGCLEDDSWQLDFFVIRLQ